MHFIYKIIPRWNFDWKLKFDSLPLLVRCAETTMGTPKAVLEAGRPEKSGIRVVEVHGAESWSVGPNPPRRPLQSVPGWFRLTLVTVA